MKNQSYGPYEAQKELYWIDKETEEDFCVWSKNGHCASFGTKDEAISHIRDIRRYGIAMAIKMDM